MNKKEVQKVQAKVEKAVGEVVALFTAQSDELEIPSKELNAIIVELTQDMVPVATGIRKGYIKKSDLTPPNEGTIGQDPSEDLGVS